MSNDNTIVQENVYTITATAPNNIQRAGVIISQGGTTASVGSSTAYLSKTALKAAIVPSAAISGLAWASGTVTVTTTVSHGIPTSTQFRATISGCSPTGYNGSFLCTVTDTNEFTYALTENPGAETNFGGWQPQSSVELSQFYNTFYQNPAAQAMPIYVLEFGFGTDAAGVSSLSTWLTANAGAGVPYEWYIHIVPRSWASETTFKTLANAYISNTSKKYFFTTVTASNYSALAGIKSIFALIESPDADTESSDGEWTIASAAYVPLNWYPTATKKITPMVFADQYGVTPWPLRGNISTLETYKAANLNYIDTGAEGGSTNTILKWGKTLDGNLFNYWYAVDAVQITGQQAVAKAIMDGSQTNTDQPLFYDQPGINRLQDVLATQMGVLQSASVLYGNVVKTTFSYGDLQTVISQIQAENSPYLGMTVVNAEPQASYSVRNPEDYGSGVYNGLTTIFVPQQAFSRIVVNNYVANFIA